MDCDRPRAEGCGSRVEELCVPGSSDSPRSGECSEDLVRRSRLVSTLDPDEESGEYGSLTGMTRRNGIEMRVKEKVPSANRRRNRPVSSLKMAVDSVDQKNALKPKDAKGNAVAVPRWSGKLVAAIGEARQR